MSGRIDRRAMLRAGGFASTAAVGALAPLSQAYAQRRRTPANDKIQVGLIGCKGMGWANLQALAKVPDVEFTALADIDDTVLAGRAAELQKASGRTPAVHKDYRRLLDDTELDAVIVATPDHWHCLQTVDACSAGKDVYVEKPLGNSIAECEAMVAAKQRHGRVVQVGQWQRSNQHFADAVAHLHGGGIGRVRKVKAWAYMAWMKKIEPRPDGPAPAGVDYDRWLGPAPERAFNPNRFHFNFRWWWDYAGGLMTDWGVHLIDIALLGMKAGAPLSVTSLGGPYAYPGSAMETPDTQTAIFDYGDYSIEWEHAVGIGVGPYGGRDHGVAFVGENGTLVVDRGQWRVIPERQGDTPGTAEIPATPAKDNGLERHMLNFVECLRDRSKIPNAPIEAAANTAVVCNMGNIAYRTGEKVFWDAAAGRFKNNPRADALIAPTYRAPYVLPPRKT